MASRPPIRPVRRRRGSRLRACPVVVSPAGVPGHRRGARPAERPGAPPLWPRDGPRCPTCEPGPGGGALRGADVRRRPFPLPPRPCACSPAEALGRCPDVGALPSRRRGRSWALRSSIRCSSFGQPLALPSSFRRPCAPLPPGRPGPVCVHCRPAGGSSSGSRPRVPPLPHWTGNGSTKNGWTSNSLTRSIRSIRPIRSIRSACGALRRSCGRPRQHRCLHRSGIVPVLPASLRGPARQPSGAVILGRDDLAATNREASADSTPRTQWPRSTTFQSWDAPAVVPDRVAHDEPPRNRGRQR